MLTADLVRATRRKGVLKITAWRGDAKARATILATSYSVIAADMVGETRRALMDAIADIPVGARERKLADGIRKLVLDRCTFESDTPVSPVELRESIFTEAAEARRNGRFDRDALIEKASATHEVPPEEVERLLFGDLKDAARLLEYVEASGPQIVEDYDRSQVQAVLLRAETVVAEVYCKSATTYRALFRKLKFLRLLHEIEADGDRYRITLSGPMSLFRSNTKYGLSLALALPSIQACDEWSIDAIVRWGKDRSKVAFRAEGKCAGGADGDGLIDEVQTFFDKQKARVEKGKSKWVPEVCSELLSVPGLGVCAPDLVLRKGDETVYFEVLGFWSRAAVWKRVELAEAGLPVPIVFAVQARLRVSEEVLPDEVPAALYVYKGVMSPARVEACLESVC